jgi:hypothetical protein
MSRYTYAKVDASPGFERTKTLKRQVFCAQAEVRLQLKSRLKVVGNSRKSSGAEAYSGQ